jgi:hypothetical protein
MIKNYIKKNHSEKERMENGLRLKIEKLWFKQYRIFKFY